MKTSRTNHAPFRSQDTARVARTAFTLIEMIATMTILAVVISVTSTVLWTAMQGFSSGSMAAQLHNDASGALERLVREFRDIPKKTTSLAPDITSVTPSSIIWNTNYSLSISGSNLMLTEAGGTSRVLLGDVVSLTLLCYNESNTPLATSLSGSACDQIHRISITITLLRGGITETARTKVFLRPLTSGA